jgi:hypothetical protein
MFSIVRQPAQCVFHSLGGQCEKRFKRPTAGQLARETRRGNRRATPVGLKPNFFDPTVNHSEIKAREISTPIVLLLTHCIRVSHHPNIARVSKVV